MASKPWKWVPLSTNSSGVVVIVQLARRTSLPVSRRAKKRSMDLPILRPYWGTGVWMAERGRDSLERVEKPEGKVVVKASRW